MPPEHRDPAYLHDMLLAARNIKAFIEGKTAEGYRADLLLRSAVERQVEILGEAARKISESFKAAHPEIPWRAIIAQRNVLVHDYDIVVEAEMWGVASTHVPALVSLLEPLVPPPPAE